MNEATEAIDEITEQTSTNGVPLTSIHGNPFIQEQPFTLDCISPFKTHPPSVDEIMQKGQGIKRKLNFNESQIDFIEKKTRLQSQQSDWFLYRKGRITASKCKRVASLKPTTSPSKTIKELKEVLYEVRCLKSTEDMILALAGQFKQLSHEPEKFR